MKTAHIKIIIIMFFLIIASPAFSGIRDGNMHIEKPDMLYSTTGGWKFHYGDNMQWASPEFDASKWETKRIPSNIDPPAGDSIPGWFWCRLNFTIDKANMSQKPLFIAIPRCFHAYEVYFNGKKYGGRGRLPVSEHAGQESNGREWEWGMGGLYRIITPAEIFSEKTNVLAIRVYEGYSLLLLSMFSYGFISSYNLLSNFFLISTIIYFLLSSIVIVVGIYHLVVFRKKDDNDSLRFAFFSIFQGIHLVFMWLSDMIDSSSRLTFSIHTFALIIELMCFLLFIYYFFEDRLKKYKKFILTLTLVLACLLPASFSSNLKLIRIAYVIFITYGIMLSPLFIYTITTEVLRGNIEVRPILYSTYLAFVMFMIDILQNLGISLVPVITFPWLFSSIGLVIFTFSVSLSISKKYSFIYDGKNNGPRQVSYLKGLDIEGISVQLKKIMDEDRVFLDSELSIKKLASMLSLTLHQLSEFLNTNMNLSYNNLINQYRIEEAKRILTEEPSIPVITAAYRAGFNTISRFYDVFKKHTGMSPSEFRRNIKK
jgi:AraC-like DNA-binding protein